MLTTFSGKSADEVWRKAASAFSDKVGPSFNGRQVSPWREFSGRGGDTMEILHSGMSITCPRDRWVVSRVPPMNPAFAIVELIGLMTAENDSKFYTFWNRRLPRYAGDTDLYEGAYGYRLRRHYGVDQLHRAYKALSKCPQSRQVVLQYYDVKIDLPLESGKPSSEDVPCNVISMLKIRDEKLEWMQVIRSNDLFLGVPYNLVQFTFLQEIMAGWLEIDVGTYNQLSDSLHVYRHDVKSISGTVPVKMNVNPDRFCESYAESMRLFTCLHSSIVRLSSEQLSEEAHLAILTESHLPSSYRNLLCILVAESARRSHFHDVPFETIKLCSNGALVQLWDRWMSRVGKRQPMVSKPGVDLN